MFRVAMFTIVAAGVMLSSTQAQAGIFFRRGGCSGGQCCAGGQCSVPMPSAATAAVPTPADEATAQAAPKDAPAPSGEATAESSAQSDIASAGETTEGPVRRIGFRRMGGIRLFARWR